MDKKLTGIVAYITWIGFLIAYLAGDKEGAKFHLNQACVLAIAGLACTVLSWVPIVRWVVWVLDLVLLVLAVMGIVSAVNDEEKPLPLIGGISVLK